MQVERENHRRFQLQERSPLRSRETVAILRLSDGHCLLRCLKALMSTRSLSEPSDRIARAAEICPLDHRPGGRGVGLFAKRQDFEIHSCSYSVVEREERRSARVEAVY